MRWKSDKRLHRLIGREEGIDEMMIFYLNGLEVSAEEGMTLLEAARFMGFPIPTLCHQDGLSPYGACRLCVVEIGEGPKAKLVSSCTYPVEEGLHASIGLLSPIQNDPGSCLRLWDSTAAV